MITENYLDPDVAYLLGMISARGIFQEARGDRRLIISFPYKNLLAEGISLKFNQETHLNLGINTIRDRIYELLETDIEVNKASGSIQIIARFLRNSMIWRNLRYLMQYKNTYGEFEIPKQIMETSPELQKEFVRGLADVAGYIRESNNYMNGKRRVYLEIQNRNWILPVQLCEMLQRKLKVPVQLIQWGHPNTREPFRLKKGETWAREHQIKIFSEAFGKIGFYVEYKQRILEEFIEADKGLQPKIRFCNPNPRIKRIKQKPKHPEEKSPRIPECLKRKHFDAPWQICIKLGCKQKKKIKTPQLEFFPDDNIET